MSDEFQLFTSLRYDQRLLDASWNTWPGNPPSPLLWLPYHLDRLIRAAHHFDWPAAVEALSGNMDRGQAMTLLRSICQECADSHSGSQGPLRIRITLSRDGQLKAQAFPTAPLDHDLLHASTFNPDSPAGFQFPARQLRAYLDTEPTPQSAFTAYKTTARGHYDAARARAGIAPAPAPAAEEVILYNPAGDVTEGSVRTVAFWRGGRWVTPRVESGCLAGTVRRWLLERGCVVEGTVRRDEVVPGEWVLLCNGVEGCLLGVVSARADHRDTPAVESVLMQEVQAST